MSTERATKAIMDPFYGKPLNPIKTLLKLGYSGAIPSQEATGRNPASSCLPPAKRREIILKERRHAFCISATMRTLRATFPQGGLSIAKPLGSIGQACKLWHWTTMWCTVCLKGEQG